MAIWFGLLGPVEVWAAGSPVNIGGPRQRAVLAILALDIGHVVSMDQLIDRVWGEDPPASAHETVYTYLSRLRGQLAAAAPREARLARRTGGYVLEADPDTVDMCRFRRLVADARSNPARASQLLSAALELWRGAALAGVDGAWLSRVRHGLDGERAAAALIRYDAELAAGRHAEVVGELHEAVASHPYDERLAGQLMLALYRSGKPAEALDVFARTGALLREELGTAPAAELSELHQRILREDPYLAAPLRPQPPVLVPRQMPGNIDGFTGRCAELDWLGAAAATGARLVVVAGTAGVGKTSLAVRFAHRVADRYPDGQLYADLRGFSRQQPAVPGEVLGRFLHALGVDSARIPADPDGRAAAYRTALAGRRVLIMLDNARSGDQVRPLLPGTADCLVLVTSRSRLDGLVAADGARLLSLDVLPSSEASTLLTTAVPRLRDDRECATALARLCGNLPLALRIAAAYLLTHPHTRPSELADRLAVDRLGVLSGDDPCAAVRAGFDLSYAVLDPAAQRLFRYLGFAPGVDIGTPAAAALVSDTPEHVRLLLDWLTAAHLVVEYADGRYRLHDLLRAYAAELCDHHDSSPSRHAAIARLLDFYLHASHTADRCLNSWREAIDIADPRPGVPQEEFADHEAALAWCDTEYPNLLAAIERAAADGLDRHAWRLPWTMVNYFHRRGHWHDFAATHQTALAAAGRLSDLRALSRIHASVVNAYAELGLREQATAHGQQAVRLAQESGDRIREAYGCRALGRACERAGQYAEALGYEQRSLALERAEGNQDGEATSLGNIGWLRALLGDYRHALADCQQALALAREIDDRDCQATTLDSLGHIHYHLGDPNAALECYRQALAIHRQFSYRLHEATTLRDLGDMHHHLGDTATAIDAWRQAVIILDALRHPDADQLRTRLPRWPVDSAGGLGGPRCLVHVARLVARHRLSAPGCCGGHTFLLHHAAVHTVNAGGRVLLAVNRRLFRGPRYLDATLATLERIPDGYSDLAQRLLTHPSPDTAEAYVRALETFHPWPVDRSAAVSIFIREHELAWLTGKLPPELA